MNKLEENTEYHSWVNLFPVLTAIVCIFSFISPLFSLYTVIWITDPLPTFVIVRYSLTLFGITKGNLELLAGLQGQAESIQLLKIPGIVIGVILILILVLIIILFTLNVTHKAGINKIKKYWALNGSAIIICAILLIVIWSFIGDYLLKSMDASDSFWGDAATIDFGILLLFIGGSISIIGYFIIKIPEIRVLRGEKKTHER